MMREGNSMLGRDNERGEGGVSSSFCRFFLRVLLAVCGMKMTASVLRLFSSICFGTGQVSWIEVFCCGWLKQL